MLAERDEDLPTWIHGKCKYLSVLDSIFIPTLGLQLLHCKLILVLYLWQVRICISLDHQTVLDLTFSLLYNLSSFPSARPARRAFSQSRFTFDIRNGSATLPKFTMGDFSSG